MVWSAECVGNTQRETSAQGWGAGEGGDDGGAEVGKMSKGLPEWKGGGHLQGGVQTEPQGWVSRVCSGRVPGGSERQGQPVSAAWPLCARRARTVMPVASAPHVSSTCCSGCCLSLCLHPFLLFYSSSSKPFSWAVSARLPHERATPRLPWWLRW